MSDFKNFPDFWHIKISCTTKSLKVLWWLTEKNNQIHERHYIQKIRATNALVKH